MSNVLTRESRIGVGTAVTEHVRSAWSIELGGLRVSRYRVVSRVAQDGRQPGLASRRWKFSPKEVAAALAALTALAMPIYLTQAKALGHTQYAVWQNVPESAQPPKVTSHPKERRHVRRVAVVKDSSIITPDASQKATITSSDEAISAAWRTGEPQDWAENGAHGIVVPGAPEQRSDGFVCRTLSRLIRREGQADVVDQSRRCSALPT